MLVRDIVRYTRWACTLTKTLPILGSMEFRGNAWCSLVIFNEAGSGMSGVRHLHMLVGACTVQPMALAITAFGYSTIPKSTWVGFWAKNSTVNSTADTAEDLLATRQITKATWTTGSTANAVLSASCNLREN